MVLLYRTKHPFSTDGRGITDLQCTDAARWVVTWTDGTTTDAGSCRVELIPTP